MIKLLSENVLAAESRIRPYIRETPVDRSLHLSRLSGAEVHLKLEHLQHTGSFKLRGACNKIFSLTAQELENGVIAASTGNHGVGVCYAARRAGTTATIYLPDNVPEQKVGIMQQLGGNPILISGDCLEAEYKAREAAQASGRVFISPYNDQHVIAGQGTIGVELARQLDRIDAVFVAVGGGGLISGIGAFLKSIDPRTRIVGCWPENSPVIYECLRAGAIVQCSEEPTISESTAGGLEEGSLTFPLCQQLIDDYVLVSESEICEAMRMVFELERWVIEGSAGVAVAAFTKVHQKYVGQNIILILCGRNIAAAKFREILCP